MTLRPMGYVAGVVIATCVLIAAFAADQDASISMILNLRDGCIVTGKPSGNTLKVKTSAGEIDVAIALISEIHVETNNSARIMFHNEDRISGTIQKDTIELTTLFGKHRIPMNLITAIQIRSGKGEIPAERKKRGETSMAACVHNLRLIESAKDAYAIEYGGTNGMALTWKNLEYYIKDMDKTIYCPGSNKGKHTPEGSYEMKALGVDAKCRIFPEIHTTSAK